MQKLRTKGKDSDWRSLLNRHITNGSLIAVQLTRKIVINEKQHCQQTDPVCQCGTKGTSANTGHKNQHHSYLTSLIVV